MFSSMPTKEVKREMKQMIAEEIRVGCDIFCSAVKQCEKELKRRNKINANRFTKTA